MTETVVSWRDAGKTRLMVGWVPCRGGVVLTFWRDGTARPARLCAMVSVGCLQLLPAQVFQHLLHSVTWNIILQLECACEFISCSIYLSAIQFLPNTTEDVFCLVLSVSCSGDSMQSRNKLPFCPRYQQQSPDRALCQWERWTGWHKQRYDMVRTTSLAKVCGWNRNIPGFFSIKTFVSRLKFENVILRKQIKVFL